MFHINRRYCLFLKKIGRYNYATTSSLNKYGDPNNTSLMIKDVSKSLNTGRKLFDNITMSFFHGAKIGILGVNGCGKSSFLKILAGIDKDYDGIVKKIHKDYKIGYLAQEPILDPNKTVSENVMDGVQNKIDLLEKFDEISNKFADEHADFDELINEQSIIQNEIEKLNCWDLKHKIDIALHKLNCPNGNNSIQYLSGGEKRRVALCRLLISEPDILLLDEPTNHLDANSVQWLETYLSNYNGLVLTITHDRYFLDKIAGYILEIDQGELYPFKGNYASWLINKQHRMIKNQKDEIQIKQAINQELNFINKNQNKINKARKLRLNKQLDQQIQQKMRKSEQGGQILIPSITSNLSNIQEIINIDNLTISIDNRILIKEFSHIIHNNARIGIIGANGTGKSTLLKAIYHTSLNKSYLPMTDGTITIDDRIKIAYNDQSRDTLNDSLLIWEEITAGRQQIQISSNHSIPSRAYVAQFNFRGTIQNKQIKDLSGGERNRVHLAKTLSYGCNMILLDEPTNDLDVDTLRALEQALIDFPGVVIIVSHDRWFLDRTCNGIIALENEQAKYYTGNYTDYKRQIKKQQQQKQ